MIVDLWYDILLCNDNTLKQACLITIDKFISWIDISFIVNERFIKLFYEFLSYPQLQNQVRHV